MIWAVVIVVVLIVAALAGAWVAGVFDNEEEEEETEKLSEMEIGLETLADKYGLENIADAVIRMLQKEQT